jgi:sporulation protein YlmC with PRC-barrel domain
MKATNIVGMPIISVSEGVKAGQVADLAIMATEPQVTALVLKTDRDQTILPFESIRKIGPDAITIDNLGLVRVEEPTDGGDATRRFALLTGKETAGDDGTYLGDLKDLDIDPGTGHINSIILHRGGVMGIGGEDITVPGTHLHAFGQKLLTMTPPALSDDFRLDGDEPSKVHA